MNNVVSLFVQERFPCEFEYCVSINSGIVGGLSSHYIVVCTCIRYALAIVVAVLLDASVVLFPCSDVVISLSRNNTMILQICNHVIVLL